MNPNRTVSIIIPAYNEEKSIADVVLKIRSTMEAIDHEIVVVNDGSSDNTAEQAESAGAVVVNHMANKGYGAALKTGIRKAKHEWVALIDADGQHDANDLLRIIDELDQGYDMVIGARDKKSYQYVSRMPGKWFLQWMATYLVGERPQDVNSGLRIFRRVDVMKYFPILPNAFSLTTTQTLAMMKDGFQVGHIPIQTAERQGRKSTVSIRDGLRTIMLIVRIATLFNPLKVFLPISVFLFFIGFLYAAEEMIRKFNIPDGATLFMLAGVIIFFFGILSDQLSAIRRMR